MSTCLSFFWFVCLPAWHWTLVWAQSGPFLPIPAILAGPLMPGHHAPGPHADSAQPSWTSRLSPTATLCSGAIRQNIAASGVLE